MFQTAMGEIEEEMGDKTKNEITLKNMSIHTILSTFDENIPSLQSIYDSKANIPNRFNKGTELDYLTILYRTVTMQQQHEMYQKLIKQFTEDEKKYSENPTVNFRTK